MKYRGQFHSSACIYPVFPLPFGEEVKLFFLHQVFLALCSDQNKMDFYLWDVLCKPVSLWNWMNQLPIQVLKVCLYVGASVYSRRVPRGFSGRDLKWVQVMLFSPGVLAAIKLVGGVALRWRRQWHPTPVLLPGKSHGRRSLVGCSSWGRKESDTTEWLPFHFPALGKEMAAHASVLAGESQGWGSLVGCHLWGRRVRHDWSYLAAAMAWGRRTWVRPRCARCLPSARWPVPSSKGPGQVPSCESRSPEGLV